MLIHISTRRNIAIDLVARGLLTQAEAAKLIGESRQAFAYMARDIDVKAARENYVSELWRDEIAKLKPKKLKRRTKQ
jgi:predicted HTH domain antitoxin